MKRLLRHWPKSRENRRLVLVALLFFAMDIVTKWAAERFLHGSAAMGKILTLTLYHNTGVALGTFKNVPVLTLLLPPVAIAAGFLLLRPYCLTPLIAVSCGVILGGFAGNFLQRLIFGYVTDMVFFPWMPWYVCNLADIGICCGAAVMGVTLLFFPGQWPLKHGKGDKPNACI